MSFNSYRKPRLVEPKLSKYYINKVKEKELREKIAQEEIIKQNAELELANQPAEPIYKHVINYIKNFIIENYGFVIMIFLLGILLWVRYIEVNKRKAQLKEVIEKMNNESNEF
jgi:hypothetical protein